MLEKQSKRMVVDQNYLRLKLAKIKVGLISNKKNYICTNIATAECRINKKGLFAYFKLY